MYIQIAIVLLNKKAPKIGAFEGNYFVRKLIHHILGGFPAF